MMFGHALALTRKSAGLSLIQQAVGILRKYGTNAHVYLPGVGTVSGITAGNYLDSAGVTAASVDNPVGLSLDALQAMTLGSELVTNGDFSAGATGWTLSSGAAVSSGALSLPAANAQAVQTAMSISANATYKITFDVSGTSAGLYLDMSIGGTFVSGAVIGLSNGTKTFTVATSNTNPVLFLNDPGSTGTCTIDNISVRQVPGIHATQATTSNKCLLRLTNGKYSWQFDGSNDSLSLSAPLFQMSDDHCVIAGFKASNSAKYEALLSPSCADATNQSGKIVIEIGTGKVMAEWAGSGSSVSIKSSASVLNANSVLSLQQSGNNRSARLNGASIGSSTTPITYAGTATKAAVAGNPFNGVNNAFSGLISPVIAIKGTLSDSDLLVLERFVGQLSGVSI